MLAVVGIITLSAATKALIVSAESVGGVSMMIKSYFSVIGSIRSLKSWGGVLCWCKLVSWSLGIISQVSAAFCFAPSGVFFPYNTSAIVGLSRVSAPKW